MAFVADPEDDKIASLAVILPLALSGFVIASGCWTLFAVAGVHLRRDLDLSGFQFGLLLSVPMAVGAILAVPAGLASVRFGARRVMLLCLLGLALCMAAMLVANSYPSYLAAAAGLGLAGGLYSAGLQFVTGHSSGRHLGLVLGVFGAGVTGVGLNYYLVPLVHEGFTWQMVPAVYLSALLLVLMLLSLLTSEERTPTPEANLSVGNIVARLKQRRHWAPYLYFGAIAGSFFALALWLPDYLAGQNRLAVEAAAHLALWFVVPGALTQVAGGALSDRFGSVRVVMRSLVVALLALFILSYPSMKLIIQGVDSLIELHYRLPLPLTRGLIVLLGMALGCGMGAMQHLVIVEDRRLAAFSAGLLLLSACSVAFLLPLVFSLVSYWPGIRSTVFMVLFLVLSGCLFLFARNRRNMERKYLLQPGI